MTVQTPVVEFDLYTMPIDAELFKIASPEKENPELFGLRLLPNDSSLPELFVWCYYSESQKCFIHNLSDVWSGYKIAEFKEYGDSIELAENEDWTWLSALLIAHDFNGRLLKTMEKRKELPRLNMLLSELTQ